MSTVERVHAWWTSRSDERFWLGFVGGDGRRELLAAPCGEGGRAATAAHRLITHVRPGDTLFHFDPAACAITACSTVAGRARRRRLAWPHGGRCACPPDRALPAVASWAVGLTSTRLLEVPVPAARVAETQWELFPALHALEDSVGGALHYPFSMSGPSETHVLAGWVFKLPALFVMAIPALARAASGERTVPFRTPAPAGARAVSASTR